jgi:hypothetical protein
VTQDVTSSALGFYYQGCYALVALLRATDDGAGVAVETHDDVVLDDVSLKTLSQLKHKAAPLSVKSDDFWKAVGNWISHLPDTGLRFRFVLTSRLPADSILRHLADNSSHPALCEALHEEAARVIAAAEAETDATPYRRRLDGCRAFVGLSDAQRLDLIQRLDVEDESFNVAEYEPKVEEHLTLTPLAIRMKVAERLIEWWDRQVAIALTGKRSRVLSRAEVIEAVTRITQLFYNDRLPDDFADKDPPEALDETPVLVRQIKLIEGTPFWINQAKQERWRARGQRDSWLSEQFSVVDRLNSFDKGLIAEWRLRFEPIEKPKSEGEAAEKDRGQQLFSWAFHEAWREVPPIHPEWKTPYLVRGTYQELANSRIVGWHPRYLSLLGDDEEPGDGG